MSDNASSEGDCSMRTGSFSDAAVEGLMSCSTLGEWLMCAVWSVSAIWMPASWMLDMMGEECVLVRSGLRYSLCLCVVDVRTR